MERGSYIAASGGLLQFKKLDIVNNNLANVNSAGFKKQLLVAHEQGFDDTLAKMIESKDPFARGDHERTPGVTDIQAVTDFSAGPIQSTGVPLDAALRDPKHFFVVNSPTGPLYTRAGNFNLSAAGTLVTQDGLEVQGDGGPISINGPGAQISADGSIRVEGLSVGKLQVVKIDNPEALERVEGTRFRVKQGTAQPETVAEATVVPQSLEMANVSIISNIVELITAQRGFEMYSKTAQSIDQLNQTAINQIGRRP